MSHVFNALERTAFWLFFAGSDFGDKLLMNSTATGIPTGLLIISISELSASI